MATQTIARSKTGRWRFTIIAVSITVIAALIVTVVIAVGSRSTPRKASGEDPRSARTPTTYVAREGGPLHMPL